MFHVNSGKVLSRSTGHRGCRQKSVSAVSFNWKGPRYPCLSNFTVTLIKHESHMSPQAVLSSLASLKKLGRGQMFFYLVSKCYRFWSFMCFMCDFMIWDIGPIQSHGQKWYEPSISMRNEEQTYSITCSTFHISTLWSGSQRGAAFYNLLWMCDGLKFKIPEIRYQIKSDCSEVKGQSPALKTLVL